MAHAQRLQRLNNNISHSFTNSNNRPTLNTHTRQPRQCLGCGADLSDYGRRKRCAACQVLHRRELYRAFERRNSTVEATREAYHAEQRKQNSKKGIEYESQDNSAEGTHYIIGGGGMINQRLRVEKICHRCKQDDTAVKGRWAPIYSDQDARGREIRTILLCLDCYEKECERY